MRSQRAGTKPTKYCHQTKNIRTSVRGDDFVSSGYLEGLEWLHDKMKKRLEVIKKLIGARENEHKEEEVLDRIIRVSSTGCEYGDHHQDATRGARQPGLHTGR